jgi:hypothetical protein
MVHVKVIVVLVLVVTSFKLLVLPAAVSSVVLDRLNFVVGRYPLLLLFLGLLLHVVVIVVVRVIDYVLEQLCAHLLLILADLRAILDEVLLVADEGDLDVLVGVLADLLEPFLEVVE